SRSAAGLPRGRRLPHRDRRFHSRRPPASLSSQAHGTEEHPAGTVSGWSGRAWHRLTAPLPTDPALRVRWRYTTDRLYVGRGAYVDGLRVERSHRVLFDESRPADAARLTATGWTASAD
ncbi:hypothetical protein ACWDRX_30915, partial [Streptomyces nigra]